MKDSNEKVDVGAVRQSVRDWVLEGLGDPDEVRWRKNELNNFVTRHDVKEFEDLPPAQQWAFANAYDIEVSAPLAQAAEDVLYVRPCKVTRPNGDVADEPAAPRAKTPAEDVQEAFQQALEQPDHPYHQLAWVLLGSYEQAALGKGKERHANDLPFDKQRMQTIARGQGNAGGLIYQVCKKAQESERMERDAKVRELQGVIVYAAGAIVFAENSST